MQKISPELSNKLSSFNQKKLEKGVIFLLAKALADSLPLAPVDTDNVAIYTLTHRRFVDEVIFSLNDYTYIQDEDRKAVYKLIEELSIWRFNVAHNPPAILFQGKNETVIDDLSCISRYVNATYLCSVSDVAMTANWTLRAFIDLCSEVKANLAADQTKQ